MSPKAEARHEHQRSSDTSPIDAARPPKTRAKWLSCRHLDFSDSRSIFFIATHPVWFGCQCSVVVKPISRLPDSSVQKQGFLDGFLEGSIPGAQAFGCSAYIKTHRARGKPPGEKAPSR